MKKIVLLVLITILATNFLIAQNKKDSKTTNKAAFYSGIYQNFFKEAGYSQSAIDQKVAQAFHDIFEGPASVYYIMLRISIISNRAYTNSKYGRMDCICSPS
jgi:oligosaccharide reducing-end xylanase